MHIFYNILDLVDNVFKSVIGLHLSEIEVVPIDNAGRGKKGQSMVIEFRIVFATVMKNI